MMSLAFPWIGAKLGWKLLDPIGGMVLSLYIIIEWCKVGPLQSSRLPLHADV
jgi:hypothetical protein